MTRKDYSHRPFCLAPMDPWLFFLFFLLKITSVYAYMLPILSRCVVVCVLFSRQGKWGRIGQEGKEKPGRSILPRYGEDRCSLPPSTVLMTFLLGPQGYLRSTKQKQRRQKDIGTRQHDMIRLFTTHRICLFWGMTPITGEVYYLHIPFLDTQGRHRRMSTVNRLWLVCELTEFC